MSPTNRITTYIALGANLGDRAGNIAAALDRLRADPASEVGDVSSLLANPAVGGPAGSPAFLNGAARIDTSLSPRALLDLLLSIERSLGRVRRTRWEPRAIDLDLILYGDRIIDEPDLSVPHPLMHQRLFVLEPLVEIAPTVIHPRLGVSMAELLRQLKTGNPVPPDDSQSR